MVSKRIGIEYIDYRGAVKRKPGKPEGLPKFDSQSAIHFGKYWHNK